VTEALRRQFRGLAAALEGRDLDVYTAANRDPDEPVLGLGPKSASIALFGRDPGRHEIIRGMPFVGVGGQKLRAGLYRAANGGQSPPDIEAAISAGDPYFWVNTVPYKPIENKAWSAAIVRSFAPLVAELVLSCWDGRDVITLGDGALRWFGLFDPTTKKAIAEFAARDDKFSTSLEIELRVGELARTLRLHPLPHPSPLNATWLARFPGLLDARLRALEVS
jgi:uracil-DNA glycosylase